MPRRAVEVDVGEIKVVSAVMVGGPMESWMSSTATCECSSLDLYPDVGLSSSISS